MCLGLSEMCTLGANNDPTFFHLRIFPVRLFVSRSLRNSFIPSVFCEGSGCD